MKLSKSTGVIEMTERKTKRLYFPAIGERGRTIAGSELLALLNTDIWHKLLYIREELQEMYPNDFLLSKVESWGGVSRQGLLDAEGSPRGDGEKIHPRTSTREKLADTYCIPRRLLEEDCTMEELGGGFFLGKKEDKEVFFDDFYLTYRKQHVLDLPGRIIDRHVYGPEYTYVAQYHSNEGFDVVDKADGSYNFDRLTLQFNVSAIQTSTGYTLWEKLLGEEVTVLESDVDALNGVISNELRFLSDRFSRMIDKELPSEFHSFKERLDAVRAIQHQAIDQMYMDTLQEFEKSIMGSEEEITSPNNPRVI